MRAVNYAATAAAAGFPGPKAVMGVAPGCLSEAVACLGADPVTIRATTRPLLVTEAADPDPVGTAAVERIWAGLGVRPLKNQDVLRLVSVAHARPALRAVHTQALAAWRGALVLSGNAPDAYDRYGTWKGLDALMGCAFDGSGAAPHSATRPNSACWACGAMGSRSRRRASPTTRPSQAAPCGTVVQHALSL